MYRSLTAPSLSPLQKTCWAVALAVIVATLSLLSSRHGIRNDTNTSLQDTPRHGIRNDTDTSLHDALTAATTTPETDNAVHVVFASTDGMVQGVEASIRSIQAHASGPVHFHYIGDAPLSSMPDVKFYSLAKTSKKYQLQDFVCLGDRRDGQNAINTMHANFARFVLDELLPRSVKKAMYLDVDTAVFCDVHRLINGVLNDDDNDDDGGEDTSREGDAVDRPIIAAVPRNHIYGLTREGEAKYGKVSPSFNAGAYIVHLERWRDRAMGAYIRNIALANNKEHWYFLGSQPPLNIAIGPHFEWLSRGWNVKAKRVKSGFKTKAGEDVCLVHWTGPIKPWQTSDEKSVELLDVWKRYGKRSSKEKIKASKRGTHEA